MALEAVQKQKGILCTQVFMVPGYGTLRMGMYGVVLVIRYSRFSGVDWALSSGLQCRCQRPERPPRFRPPPQVSRKKGVAEAVEACNTGKYSYLKQYSYLEQYSHLKQT